MNNFSDLLITAKMSHNNDSRLLTDRKIMKVHFLKSGF